MWSKKYPAESLNPSVIRFKMTKNDFSFEKVIYGIFQKKKKKNIFL